MRAAKPAPPNTSSLRGAELTKGTSSWRGTYLSSRTTLPCVSKGDVTRVCTMLLDTAHNDAFILSSVPVVAYGHTST